MKRSQKGMVLFMVIVFLAILTTLILTLMQSVFLYIKASNQLVEYHQSFYQLESAANQLQALDLSTIEPQCRLRGKTSNDVIKLLKGGRGCEWMMENQSYAYLLDDLGEYPCLQIKNKQSLMSSRHFLVSVITKDPPYKLLQLRIAKIDGLGICQDKAIFIDSGVISWRYLTDF